MNEERAAYTFDKRPPTDPRSSSQILAGITAPLAEEIQPQQKEPGEKLLNASNIVFSSLKKRA